MVRKKPGRKRAGLKPEAESIVAKVVSGQKNRDAARLYVEGLLSRGVSTADALRELRRMAARYREMTREVLQLEVENTSVLTKLRGLRSAIRRKQHLLKPKNINQAKADFGRLLNTIRLARDCYRELADNIEKSKKFLLREEWAKADENIERYQREAARLTGFCEYLETVLGGIQ